MRLIKASLPLQLTILKIAELYQGPILSEEFKLTIDDLRVAGLHEACLHDQSKSGLFGGPAFF